MVLFIIFPFLFDEHEIKCIIAYSMHYQEMLVFPITISFSSKIFVKPLIQEVQCCIHPDPGTVCQIFCLQSC